MKPKVKGRDWWGRRSKSSWGAQDDMHSSRMKILEMNQQVKDFLKGEKFVKTQESLQSEES